MLADKRWIFNLDEEEISEINHALETIRQKKIPWQKITKEDFPLERLSKKLSEISQELEYGSGLASLRGLAVGSYDDIDLRRLWFGLGLHLGSPLYQDCNGLLMRDICDERQDTDTLFKHQLQTESGERFVSSKARTLSNQKLRFHTDRCDVVSLLCVRQAVQGGISKIASSTAVHNAILESRPDLIKHLYAPFYRSRLGEEKWGETQTYSLPIFGVHNGNFTSHYSRTYIEAAQEMESVPRMSDAQWEAIDLLHETAESLCFEMSFAPGDMQFLNNHVIYHARTAFEDDVSKGTKGRLLLRLWLSMPNSRALPEDHSVLWKNTDGGSLRGGIGQAE
ncbi:MAG: TauD/TfdA family dioxygenase [SAR324 cluster bacterium]|nr:TauD/TfdA family dioxygenase [SAR324 cluster bacterium]